MKNYKVFIRIFIAVLVIAAFSFAGAAFAKAAEYKMLTPQTKVPADKILTIKFTNELRESTVNTKNIFVRDASNKNVSVNVKLDSTKKVILIEPVKKYDYGKTYTIYVKRNVKYKSGKYLKNGIGLKFTAISKSDAVNTVLPVIGSIDKLKQLAEKYKSQNNNLGIYIMNDVRNSSAASAAKSSEESKSLNTIAGTDQYSSTNIQVQGVDEGDTVKTDGQYIYKISGNRVIVIKVLSDNKLEVADIISYDNGKFAPREIYIDNSFLTVIGTAYYEIKNPADSTTSRKSSAIKPDYIYQRETTKAIIYDISNRENLKQLREVDIEGNYVSSRKIGSKLYLVSNKYIDYYCIENGLNEAAPSYKDSAAGNEFLSIGFNKIRYFPDSINLNYLVTVGIDLDDIQKPVYVSAYLGTGDIVYVSLENMYVSINKYNYNIQSDVKTPEQSSNGTSVKTAIIGIRPYSVNTIVYKFSIDSGNIYYTDKAEVPGSILNQFSMDENKGYLRMATTTGQTWWGSTDKSQNNLYILDSRMNISGKIEGLAPGEKIYSSRFIGDRGYIVTYKKVDPLFVIDLKNPESPKIEGYLKIPGYSQYLHPYDENHIIGIGKDSIEIPDKSGNTENSRAFYLGMKAAIFDITDVKNPREMFVTKLGDRGTDSEVLYNHKALLFSKDKSILAFPVSLYELNQGQSEINAENGYPEYGRFTFQGAYIYSIDLVNGLKLKGRITHYDNNINNEEGYYAYDDSRNIDRIIYIGNTLYTISNGIIKAVDMDSMKEKFVLALP